MASRRNRCEATDLRGRRRRRRCGGVRLFPSLRSRDARHGQSRGGGGGIVLAQQSDIDPRIQKLVGDRLAGSGSRRFSKSWKRSARGIRCPRPISPTKAYSARRGSGFWIRMRSYSQKLQVTSANTRYITRQARANHPRCRGAKHRRRVARQERQARLHQRPLRYDRDPGRTIQPPMPVRVPRTFGGRAAGGSGCCQRLSGSRRERIDGSGTGADAGAGTPLQPELASTSTRRLVFMRLPRGFRRARPDGSGASCAEGCRRRA